MISTFFINRPIFATVTALIMVVAGLLALDYLPIAQYPEITPPTVQVSAVYPGASAQTVAQTVGIPIEQQVNGVDGMLYMSSTSSSSGMYSLTITFEVGTDIDMATIMVQNRVTIAQSSLPEPVIVQGITTRKQSTNIVMMLTLNSENPVYNGLYLSNYASINLVDELTRLPGVGQVSVMGAGNYSMRVWLKPQEMRIRNVTPEMVYAAIQAQNMEVSAGYVGQPISNGYDPYQYTLTVQGRLVTPEEFGEIVIRAGEGGRLLRLRDIARIEQGSASYNVTSKLNGKETAAIAIYQLPGSNSLNVSKVVREKMEQLSSTLPEGVHYEVTLDTTDVVNASIHEVLITFLITTLLVVLVIYLFLQNFRAVIIPCLTIPVSLIGTLAVMELLGFSINTLTLFGLILAIAIVVDDAIVVVENSSRLLSTGKYSTKDAVIEAMREITGPVIGVVLVLLAVFIPTTFISGISGQLYKQFALTIAASTVLSGFNSLTLTPALCALFLEKEPEPRFFLFRWFNKGFDKTTNFYKRTANTLLNHPAPTLIGYALLTVLTLWWFMKWPTSFIPTEDEGYFLVSIQLPAASSLGRTEAVGEQITDILKQYPEVKSFIGVSGFSIMGGGEQSNNGTFFVILKNWSERKGKEHTATAVVNRFNEQASAIQAAQIFAIVPPAIPGLGAFGGLQMELEDRRNLGPTELQNAVQDLMRTYRSRPEILQLTSMYQANVPQYFLNIDRDKVQVMGLQLNDVFQTLSLFMGASYVNDYVQYGRIYQVKIEASDQAQKVIGDVLKLGVLNSAGKMVPFAAFTTIEQQLGLDQISRYNMYSSAAISAVVNPKYSSGQGIKAMEGLVQEELGNDFGYDWTSVAYQENQSSSTTTLIFGMALIVVILVLAAQYESWTSPIAVIMGLPIAILGTMIGCFIMGIPISIYTQIGIVLLIALSAKNGILVVEFARDYRAQGNSIHDSALEGGTVRLRPILMTSFAFVFGVLPLLFATGAGAESRISLGTAVVFGMAMNAIFATLFVPNFYAFMQTIQEKYINKISPKHKDAPGAGTAQEENLPAVRENDLPAVKENELPAVE